MAAFAHIAEQFRRYKDPDELDTAIERIEPAAPLQPTPVCTIEQRGPVPPTKSIRAQVVRVFYKFIFYFDFSLNFSSLVACINTTLFSAIYCWLAQVNGILRGNNPPVAWRNALQPYSGTLQFCAGTTETAILRDLAVLLGGLPEVQTFVPNVWGLTWAAFQRMSYAVRVNALKNLLDLVFRGFMPCYDG